MHVQPIQKPAAVRQRPRAAEAAQATATPDRYVDEEEGAALFNVGRTKFRQLIREGLVPQPIKLGRSSRWSFNALQAAMAHLVQASQQAA